MKSIVLTMLFICSLSVGFGQSSTQFLTPIEEVSLSSIATEKVKRLKKAKHHQLVIPVAVAGIKELVMENSGVLPINIPTTSIIHNAKTKRVELYGDNHYLWEGEFIDGEGSIIFIVKEGEVFGHINTLEEQYDLRSLEKGKSVFISYNKKEEKTGRKCGIDGKHKNQAFAAKAATYATTTNPCTTASNVRILVVYTDEALEADANIHETAELAIESMESAIINSNVQRLSISLAGVSRVGFKKGTEVDDDIELLIADAEVKALREQHLADIVVLMVESAYGSVLGTAADIGASQERTYAIVSVANVLDKFVFSHEVSHLFGCGHEIDNDRTFEHAYGFLIKGFITKKWRQTIMYSTTGSGTINHYSNPSISYSGEATGTISSNNNAVAMRIGGEIIEEYFPDTPSPVVSISGPATGVDGSSYSLQSSICNISSTPVSYQWEYGYDGFNYTGWLGNESNAQIRIYGYDDVYIRLTATFQDGTEAVAYHKIKNLSTPDDGGGGNDPCANSILKSNKDTEVFVIDPCGDDNMIVLYPNPIEEQATLEYMVKEAGYVQLSLLSLSDISGHKQPFYQGEKAQGIYKHSLNVSSLAPGLYLLEAIINGKIISERIEIK